MTFNYRGVLVAGLLLAHAAGAADPTLILVNGRVWTADPDRPWAEAIAVTGDRITAVGRSAQIGKLAGPGTKVLDAGKHLVIPGFNDAHTHFLGGAVRMSQVDLTGASNMAEIRRRILAWAESHPAATWIVGGGWEYSLFPGGLPVKAALDEVTGGRPAFLSAYDGHTGWANSAALERAGVRKGLEFRGFGGVVFDTNGEPTGVLKEHAQRLVSRFIPDPSHDQDVESLREAMKLAARLGITSIQNASGGVDSTNVYRALRERGELTVRVAVAMSVGPQTRPESIERIRQWSEQYHDSLLRVKAVKFVLDGVIEAHTALMLRPYSDAPDTSGQSSWTQDTYNEMVAQCDKAGLQILTHAIGDGAVRMALNGYENMYRVNGRHDARPRVEHIETIAASDIPRFGRLGIMASFQPIHADPGTAEIWTKAIGDARASRGFAWRSIQRTGGRLVFSSDWPATISVDPIRGIHCAVNRQTADGEPRGGWYPKERVGVETALRAYTAAGAYASFEEKEKGTITPGKFADFVVLSHDLFRILRRDIHSARVLTTVMGGKVLYSEGRDGPARATSVD